MSHIPLNVKHRAVCFKLLCIISMLIVCSPFCTLSHQFLHLINCVLIAEDHTRNILQSALVMLLISLDKWLKLNAKSFPGIKPCSCICANCAGFKWASPTMSLRLPLYQLESFLFLVLSLTYLFFD